MNSLERHASEKLRVFLADDHPIVRGGLKALIDAQPDMCVVGEASDGEAALEAVCEERPDVVVMDLSMPKLDGAEATARIKQRCPEVKVLALTVHEDAAYVRVLLQAGASGYVLKRSAAEDLVRALHALAAGGMYLDPSIAAHVVTLGPAHGGEGALPGAELSEREAEVLRAIAEGHAMKEISARLDISARTLETYKARAMEKLGLKSRVDIVRFALRRGWLGRD